nr:MAG TPA: hypothetical protein [Caudoviricetes sp.]
MVLRFQLYRNLNTKGLFEKFTGLSSSEFLFLITTIIRNLDIYIYYLCNTLIIL